MINKNNSNNFRYYTSNHKRHISFGIKLLRFIVRYILPVIFVSLSIAGTGLIIYHYFYHDGIIEKYAFITFIACIIIFSLLAAVLSNAWFKLISRLEDTDNK